MATRTAINMLKLLAMVMMLLMMVELVWVS